MANCYLRDHIYGNYITLKDYIIRVTWSWMVLNCARIYVVTTDIDINAPLWAAKTSPTVIKKGDMTIQMYMHKDNNHNLYYYIRTFYKGILFANESRITVETKAVPCEFAALIQKFFEGYECDYEFDN